MALRSALRSRARRLRASPAEAVVFELEWIGARLLRALPPRARRERRVSAFRGLLYRGSGVHCPCCAGDFRFFLPDAHGRPDVVCPRCFSQERHRALWLWLEGHPVLLRGRLLHFAPEPSLARRLAGRPGLAYVSTDLDSPLAQVHADITALPFADGEFDLAICSHVLEHIPDDRAAMAELHRVLRPGGTALVMVPIPEGVDTTREDPAVITPQERLEAYLQEDHVRLYGRDFGERLAAAGFRVEPDDFVAAMSAAERRRLGLSAIDTVFACVR